MNISKKVILMNITFFTFLKYCSSNILCPANNCQKCEDVQVCRQYQDCYTSSDSEGNSYTSCQMITDYNDCKNVSMCTICNPHFVEYKSACTRPNCDDPNCETCEENTTYCLTCFDIYKYQNTCYIGQTTPCGDWKCTKCDQRNLNCAYCREGYYITDGLCSLEAWIIALIVIGSLGFVIAFIVLVKKCSCSCSKKDNQIVGQAANYVAQVPQHNIITYAAQNPSRNIISSYAAQNPLIV